MKALLTLSLLLILSSGLLAQDKKANKNMSFFLTSVGSGNGADLGGLEGADAHCQSLAEAVGSTGKTWHAYLSAAASGENEAVHAKDRIGDGPWYNSKGAVISKNVDGLHGEDANLSKEGSLSENGEAINGRGDSPNKHDILTGSNLDGTLFVGDGDTTCSNWTSQGEGSARLGHHDRTGGGDNPTSWNSAHGSRGCSQANLEGTGGDGLFYCFASEK